MRVHLFLARLECTSICSYPSGWIIVIAFLPLKNNDHIPGSPKYLWAQNPSRHKIPIYFLSVVGAHTALAVAPWFPTPSTTDLQVFPVLFFDLPTEAPWIRSDGWVKQAILTCTLCAHVGLFGDWERVFRVWAHTQSPRKSWSCR